MNYYKITSESENHRGLQYHDGIVTDSLPFEPNGDCEPGGLYFAREDIFAFLDYGPWIRKVEPIGEVYTNPSYPRKFKAHALKCDKRRPITIEVVQELLDEGADPCVMDSTALRYFARTGKTDIVKLLLKFCDPKAYESSALRYAAYNGHIEIVKMLIPVSDPKDLGSAPLRDAVRKGHTEIVKLLIPVSDPNTYGHTSLKYALSYWYMDIVKLLVPVSGLNENQLIDLASSYNNKEISALMNEAIKLLSPEQRRIPIIQDKRD